MIEAIAELSAQIKALGLIAQKQASTAAALHASIVEVRPYAISMRWMPLLMGFVGGGLLVNAALLYAILMALMKR